MSQEATSAAILGEPAVDAKITAVMQFVYRYVQKKKQIPEQIEEEKYQLFSALVQSLPGMTDESVVRQVLADPDVNAQCLAVMQHQYKFVQTKDIVAKNAVCSRLIETILLKARNPDLPVAVATPVEPGPADWDEVFHG